MYNWVVKQPHQHKMDGDHHKKKWQKTPLLNQVKKDHQNNYKSQCHKKGQWKKKKSFTVQSNHLILVWVTKRSNLKFSHPKK